MNMAKSTYIPKSLFATERMPKSNDKLTLLNLSWVRCNMSPLTVVQSREGWFHMQAMVCVSVCVCACVCVFVWLGRGSRLSTENEGTLD